MKNFKPKCSSTGIGSIPHRNYKRVIDDILNDFDIPYWPQIFNRGFVENMYVQFAKNMPCLNLDFENEKIFFDTTCNTNFHNFYERIVNEDFDYFKIPKKYASGFYGFLDRAKELEYVKGQTTGPISFGLSVLDQDRKPILYNSAFFEAVVYNLTMKARWQAKNLKEISKNVIMFFDEPYMSSYGSAYISLEKETALWALNEVLDGVKKEGAITGIHCCGNTDWNLVMSSNADIVSFDAYNFSDRFSLYASDINEFLKKGCIAWGIVPTSNDIINEDCESLVNKLEHKIEELVDKGINKKLILRKSLITPSCGAGSLYYKAADKVLRLTSEVSGKMKEKYF